MLAEFDLVKIGYIHKAHGIKGFVSVSFEDDLDELAKVGNFFFIDQHGCPVPFRVNAIRQANYMTVKFDGFDTPESCAPILQHELYLERQYLPMPSGENGFRLSDLEGIEIFDNDKISIGTITKVEEYPQQIMLSITKGKTVRLLPLVIDWIVNENFIEERKIIFDLPEGMLDLE